MNILIPFGVFVFIVCCAISYAIGRNRSKDSENLGKVASKQPSPATSPVNIPDAPSPLWIRSSSWTPPPSWMHAGPVWRAQPSRDTLDSFVEMEVSSVDTEDYVSATISFRSTTDSNFSSPENVKPDIYLTIWETEHKEEVADILVHVIDETIREMTEKDVDEVLVAKQGKCEQDIRKSYGFCPQNSLQAEMQAQDQAEMEANFAAQMESGHVEVEDISSSAPQPSQGNLRRSNCLSHLW